VFVQKILRSSRLDDHSPAAHMDGVECLFVMRDEPGFGDEGQVSAEPKFEGSLATECDQIAQHSGVHFVPAEVEGRAFHQVHHHVIGQDFQAYQTLDDRWILDYRQLVDEASGKP
jgi:hypothetical protein